jgi:hypothetical protein
MATVGTLQDQELMAQKQLTPLAENGAGSETISERNQKSKPDSGSLPAPALRIQLFHYERSFLVGKGWYTGGSAALILQGLSKS